MVSFAAAKRAVAQDISSLAARYYGYAAFVGVWDKYNQCWVEDCLTTNAGEFRAWCKDFKEDYKDDETVAIYKLETK